LLRSPPRSTRAVLLVGSIVVLLAVLGAAAWIGYAGSADEADELFDARLATSARVLAALVAARPAADAGPPIIVSFPAPLESRLRTTRPGRSDITTRPRSPSRCSTPRGGC
jgi:two-component system sensor histidine kinase QseC